MTTADRKLIGQLPEVGTRDATVESGDRQRGADGQRQQYHHHHQQQQQQEEWEYEAPVSVSTGGKAEMLMAVGSNEMAAKASPPRLVRREKRPPSGGSGYGDRRSDDTSSSMRSDYIPLMQLEEMLISGRMGVEVSGDGGGETERCPPRRLPETPKRRGEVYEKRPIMAPPPSALRVGEGDSMGERTEPISDSGYSTLEETLARIDRERELRVEREQRALLETRGDLETTRGMTASLCQTALGKVESLQASVVPSDGTSVDRWKGTSVERSRTKQGSSSGRMESYPAAESVDLRCSTFSGGKADRSVFLGSTGSERGSTGSDRDRGSSGSSDRPGDLRPGYAPVKSRGDRGLQGRAKTVDCSKLEDIRMLSTAIWEYLQSRSSSDDQDDLKKEGDNHHHTHDDDDSNYTIFKNADAVVTSPPPLPQKKHRVLPSPVRVGQSARTCVGGAGQFSPGNDTGVGTLLLHSQLDDDVQSSTLVPNLAEPTHMNWEEVLREARMLGIPLSRSSSRCRGSGSDRRSSVSSSAASSDISHQSSPCSSPIRTTKRKTVTDDHARSSSTKDRADQKQHGGAGSSNKLSIFSLQGWLSKLRRSDRSSGKDSSASTTPKRRQHLSCSSDRNNSVSAATMQAQSSQRRSLSASATQRNRINLGTTMMTDSCTCSPVPHISATTSSNKSPSYRPTSSLTYDISASGSRGSSNSFLSTSMVASPSSSSLGSVFSRSSRGSGGGGGVGTPLTIATTSRDRNNIGLHGSSPLSSSVSPMSPAGGGQGQRTPASAGSATLGGGLIAQQPPHPRRPSKSPTRYSRNLDLMKTIDQLKDCGWYWGSLGWEDARMKLDGAPDGSFLLRDSSDDRYLFSLSFKSQGKVHHTRIEHYKGSFNFSSQPTCLASTSIVELIDRAMVYSLTHPYVSCLQPRPPGLNPIPIQLLYPVSRSTLLPSLQQLCRSAIVGIVRIDDIDRLPITDRLKNYVRISQQV